ncbi:MAG: methyl-accepting chemotaxis protein [Firmicutes bacterium]|nr:methyl-accepting chemotaxis protein [Bacillota bacterium]
MRIATRLYLGFAIILVLMLGLAAYGIFQVVQVDNRLTKVNQQDSVEQRQAINDLIDYQEASIATQVNGVIDETAGFAAGMLLITVIALIAGIIIAYTTVQRMVKTIGGEPEDALALIARIARGDLSVAVKTKHKRSIMAAVGTLAKDLRVMIREAVNASSEVAAASLQLAQTSQQNEKLIAQQQEETGQGAAAIEQMSTTVQEVANHTVQAGAGQAVEVMQRGNQQAQRSVEQAQRAGEALQAIHESVALLNDMNAQIATAAEEQSTVAHEINQNFSRITHTASTSLKGAREISEASATLEALAASLQTNVAKFQIDEAHA